MKCPDLNSIRIALFTALQAAIARETESGLAYLAAPAQGNNPDGKCILIFAAFIPGSVDRLELGGSGALARRKGIFKATISSLPNEDADLPWDIAQGIERFFMRYALEPLAGAVYCEAPYSESIGMTPDNRQTITVTVPWWTWTQFQEGEKP